MGLIRLQPERLEPNELALTQKGVVIGTMDYLSPEQALNSQEKLVPENLDWKGKLDVRPRAEPGITRLI